MGDCLHGNEFGVAEGCTRDNWAAEYAKKLSDTEASARKDADEALQGNIEAEMQDRKDADGDLMKIPPPLGKDLASAIANEYQNRISTDEDLQSQIDALESADIEIREDIDNCKGLLTEEKTAREQADETLQGNIDKKQDASFNYSGYTSLKEIAGDTAMIHGAMWGKNREFAGLGEVAQQVSGNTSDIEGLKTDIGYKIALATENKDSIVEAVNELVNINDDSARKITQLESIVFEGYAEAGTININYSGSRAGSGGTGDVAYKLDLSGTWHNGDAMVFRHSSQYVDVEELTVSGTMPYTMTAALYVKLNYDPKTGVINVVTSSTSIEDYTIVINSVTSSNSYTTLTYRAKPNKYTILPTRIGTWVDGTPIWRVAIPLTAMSVISINAENNSWHVGVIDILRRLAIIKSENDAVYINDRLCFQNADSYIHGDFAVDVSTYGSGFYHASAQDGDWATHFYGWIEFATDAENITSDEVIELPSTGFDDITEG